ncbi:MAG: hypothetical protein KBD76_03600 [Bacteriovorax sp.]|nr:hypothetical protein [Bacteriovorax sp.]
MDNKNLSVEARLNQLSESFKEKNPKQMRTIRNNLNNRIRSFEEELKFGKALPKISASHMFFDFELKDCKTLLAAAQKQIKNQK